MEHVMSHDELQELLGAYALHATDLSETVQVTDHVEYCRVCRDELAMMLETAAAIGGCHPVTPAASTWDRIITTIRAEAAPAAEVIGPATNADSADAVVPADAVVHVSIPADSVRANVIDLETARAERVSRRRRWRNIAVAAAATAAVVIPITAQVTGGPATSIAALARNATHQANARLAMLRADDGTIVARAVLTRSGSGYLLDSRLPKLPAGKTYQLWAVTGKGTKPISAALLGQQPGVSAFTVAAPTSAFAISVEDAAGAIEATTKPIAVGALT